MKKFVLFLVEFSLLIAACCVMVEAQGKEELKPTEAIESNHDELCNNLTRSLSMYLVKGLQSDQYLIDTDIARAAITKILENNCDLSDVVGSMQYDLFYKG